MTNDLDKARIFSNLERWVREQEEFAKQHPHLAEVSPDIRVAYQTHCYRELKGQRVPLQEAYKHVKNCKRCQEDVDTARTVLNRSRKDPIPPLEFN